MRFASLLFFNAILLHGAASFEPSADGSVFQARLGGSVAAVSARSIQFPLAGSIEIEGARGVAGEGLQKLPGVIHYMTGNDPSRWRWNVPRYAEATFRSVRPGVDVLYHAEGDRLEFDFQVAAGSDPSMIRLKLGRWKLGAITFAPDGSVLAGNMVLHRPRAWQGTGRQCQPVNVDFAPAGANRVRFKLGPYRHDLPLTIDPVIDFATFLGGSGNESGTHVAVGPDGAVYIAGTTASTDFPASLPALDPLNRPEVLLVPTAYVSRMSPDGSTLAWSLFVGGTAQQTLWDLKCDSSGNVYVMGSTSSPNFPITSGAYQSNISPSGTDLFVVKLDGASGNVLASTFLGISPGGISPALLYPSATFHLAVDAAGGIYVGGTLLDPAFTPTPGTLPANPFANEGAENASFIVKLNASATAAEYVTNLALGSIAAMDVDASGNVIAGGTTLSGVPFTPVNPIVSIDQTFTSLNGYLAKVNSTGTALLFVSLLHGTGGRGNIEDVKIDAAGDINLLGYTPGSSFPQVSPLVPPPSSQSNSAEGPFLIKIPSSGVNVLQSTWFTGPEYSPSLGQGLPSGQSLTLLPNGSLCIAGLGSVQFQQTAGGLTATRQAQQLVGASTAPATTLGCTDPAGTTLAVKTGIPEASTPTFTSVAATPDNALIFSGFAYGALPTTPRAFQSSFAGGTTNFPTDAYIMRVSLSNPAPNLEFTIPASLLLNSTTKGTTQIDLYGTGFTYGATVQWNGSPVTSTFLTANHIAIPALPLTSVQPGANSVTVAVAGPGGGTSVSTFQGYNAGPGPIVVFPAAVAAGSGATQVTVGGSSVTPASILNWNGAPRTATYTSNVVGGYFTVLLQPSELAQPGSIKVTITNPGPGGGTSLAVPFTVEPAGAAVPAVTARSLAFSASAPLGPQVTVGGSNFSSGIQAFWDGAPVPTQFVSATLVTITPPAADLAHIGKHSLYVTSGGVQSIPVTMAVNYGSAQAPNLSYSAADAAGTRLYVLSVPNNNWAAPADLVILDLTTGAVAGTVPAIVSDALAIAVSQDGNYVYIASGDSSGVAISRYNVSLAAVDLNWNVPDSSSTSATGLATVAGAPQTVVVLSGGVATIYDGSQPRWRSTAYPVASQIGAPPVLATASRVYFSSQPGLSGSGQCWEWLDFDLTGVTSVQNRCAEVPDGMLQDGVLGYLSDGQRTLGVSLPGTGASISTPPQVVAVDLAGGNAYFGGISSPLTEFNLSTGAQIARLFQYNNTGKLRRKYS